MSSTESYTVRKLDFLARAQGRLPKSLVRSILVALVIVSVIWWIRLRPREVVALLHVSSHPPTSPVVGHPKKHWEIMQRTQLAYLKSFGFLQTVLSDPQIAALPLVADHADPVAWLHDELQAQFEQNSEILSIRLSVPTNRQSQAQTLLNAVVSAYLRMTREAEQERLQQQLQDLQVEYDSLRAQVKELSDEIAALREQRGVEDPEARLLQIEVDRHVEKAGKLKAELELAQSQSVRPPSVRLIQPPTLVR